MEERLIKIENYIKKFYPAISIIMDKGIFSKKYIYFYNSKPLYLSTSNYTLKVLFSSRKRDILEEIPLLIDVIYVDDDYPILEDVKTFLFKYAEEYSIGGIARKKITAITNEDFEMYKSAFGKYFIEEVTDLSIWYWGVLNHQIPLITITPNNWHFFNKELLWFAGNILVSTHLESLSRIFKRIGNEVEVSEKIVSQKILEKISSLTILPYESIDILNDSYKKEIDSLGIDIFSPILTDSISNIAKQTFNLCENIYYGRPY